MIETLVSQNVKWSWFPVTSICEHFYLFSICFYFLRSHSSFYLNSFFTSYPFLHIFFKSDPQFYYFYKFAIPAFHSLQVIFHFARCTPFQWTVEARLLMNLFSLHSLKLHLLRRGNVNPSFSGSESLLSLPEDWNNQRSITRLKLTFTLINSWSLSKGNIFSSLVTCTHPPHLLDSRQTTKQDHHLDT